MEALIGKYFSVILDIISHNYNDRMSSKRSSDEYADKNSNGNSNNNNDGNNNDNNSKNGSSRASHGHTSINNTTQIPPPHFEWQPSSHLKAAFEVLLRACPSKAWHFHARVLGQILCVVIGGLRIVSHCVLGAVCVGVIIEYQLQLWDGDNQIQ